MYFMYYSAKITLHYILLEVAIDNCDRKTKVAMYLLPSAGLPMLQCIPLGRFLQMLLP